MCIGWGWWQKLWLKFYGVLSPLEADPLELWVLKWKRQLHIMTLGRRHNESSVCVERSYSNKHIPATMHLEFVHALNVCAYVNIGGGGSILKATDRESSLLWRTLWSINMMKQSRSDGSHSTCLDYVSPLSSVMFVSSAEIFWLLVCISWVALAQITWQLNYQLGPKSDMSQLEAVGQTCAQWEMGFGKQMSLECL